MGRIRVSFRGGGGGEGYLPPLPESCPLLEFSDLIQILLYTHQSQFS